jgi:CHAT domain-containing protein
LQPNPSGSVSQGNLIKARDVIESLQVAELNNFFQEACLTVKSKEIDTFDPESTVIYPIILKDRLEIIATFPDQSIHHYMSAVSAQELEKVLAQLRFNLVIRSRRDFFAPAQQVYKWLIEPLEKDLELYQIQTLVFVLDTALRNIPITALYDGEKYLIEKYAIAVTPSLRLLEPQPLKNTNLYTLASGITETRDNFPPLYYVEQELKNIQKNVPSRILLNQAFTEVKFEKSISSETFPIVHIATHGQFSSNVDKTFILTWDEQLNILQLEKLLRGQEIELLVLSACESAAGDRRAALGLAGMAVRSGARSTLATLWSVNDEASAQFMNYFYQALASKKMTKAQAVREAQSKLLTEPKFGHPFYWSAYILVGNWL